MTSYFLDINVWLGLTLDSHELFPAARRWYDALPPSADLIFCRLTQIGFLRLLTTQGVSSKKPLSQREAWAVYDEWLSRRAAIFEDEPFGIDLEFRAYANQGQPAPKDFADSYLAAFATARSLELVSFDQGLCKRVVRSTLLTAKHR